MDKQIEAVEDEISAKVGDLRACLVKGQVEEAKESGCEKLTLFSQ